MGMNFVAVLLNVYKKGKREKQSQMKLFMIVFVEVKLRQRMLKHFEEQVIIYKN